MVSTGTSLQIFLQLEVFFQTKSWGHKEEGPFLPPNPGMRGPQGWGVGRRARGSSDPTLGSVIFTRQRSHMAAVPKPTEATPSIPHTQGQQLGLQGQILALRAVQGSCKVKASVSEQKAQLGSPQGRPLEQRERLCPVARAALDHTPAPASRTC